jgi:hypothetical protein
MSVCEESLEEEFVCVVCLFVEFVVLENVHSSCEFCDSTLILSRLSVFEFVASLVVSSALKNLANETQSSESSSSAKKEESEIEKKIVFTSCSSVYIFISLSIESLFALVFFVSDLNSVISFERSSAFLNSKKSEIVRIKEIEFLDEKIVIESDVSNLCETNSSSSSSLNDSCVEIIKIDEEKEKKRSSFCFESFVIDFLFDCYQNCQKKSAKKKRKEKMSFETFNQYRESRSISNENDANLTQDVLEERKLSKSTSREREAAFVTKKIVQFRFSTTVSSLQALQMLLR